MSNETSLSGVGTIEEKQERREERKRGSGPATHNRGEHVSICLFDLMLQYYSISVMLKAFPDCTPDSIFYDYHMSHCEMLPN